MLRNEKVIAAIIAAVGVVLAAAVTGVFGLVDAHEVPAPTPSPSSKATDESRSPSPGASSPSAASPSAAHDHDITVTSPPSPAKISASRGVTVSGTAGNLGGDSVWLLDYDPLDDKQPYYQVNERPIPVVNGKWAFHDAPIGDGQDAPGTTYYVAVVRANPTCAKTLASAKPNSDNDVVFAALPKGCSVVELVTLVRDRP